MYIFMCPHSNEPDTSDEDFSKQPTFVKFLTSLWYCLISQSEILCYLVIIIYQIESSSLLSLPLPLLTFLWGSLAVPRPTKTFWVTIITYTETIVIIKFFFQFNFWSWNVLGPCLQPVDPYKCPQLIIGISRVNYNVVLDLMLLLAVFFHRFMLKSFGLWRNSNYPTTEDPISETKDLPLEEEQNKEIDENDMEIKSECSDFMELDDDHSSSSGIKFSELLSSYLQPFKQFFHNLCCQEKLTDDVYAYMFFCDFINFLILVFGYNAFGMAGSGTVTSYFEENRIPVPFLAMLLAQFAAIVIDRALYLRKHIFGKIVFQIIMIIIIHLWMFFLLPAFSHNLSSTNGLPNTNTWKFFCKKYNYINLILFKLYLTIPFLFELRALMDWIWTNTSLAVGNWFKMEDIFAHVFVLKCYRRAEVDYPFPRGAPRPALSKYGIGGTMLTFMILVIWFPLVFFALGNTVGKRNPPLSTDLKLSIPGYQPIFTVSAQNDSFFIIKEDSWKKFYQEWGNFLNRYEREDVTVVPFQINALGTWGISPPSRKLLIEQLKDQNDVTLSLAISFTRSTEVSAISDKTVTYERSQRVPNYTIPELIDMINNTDSSNHKVNFNMTFLPLFLVLSDKEPVKNPRIIGLYTTFVLLLHRIIRSSFLSGTSFTIMFDDMPNVDRVLELCLDIYMVRENQELALEEDLFAKLIFLYRSPETLIKWTRSEENAGGSHNE
ncbi:Piezo [Cordylochernes scorpioides]|uniref:Piezo n=1 Tax=Cordylochernes scorpioides TaxID=51811 RepID=A0ABY6LV42_9ARAC|nr:Piezo [Cordylochernes scorpioides]